MPPYSGAGECASRRPVRDLVVEMLQMEGHRVLTASSGMDGLAMVRAIRPDLILVDFQCPE